MVSRRPRDDQPVQDQTTRLEVGRQPPPSTVALGTNTGQVGPEVPILRRRAGAVVDKNRSGDRHSDVTI